MSFADVGRDKRPTSWGVASSGGNKYDQLTQLIANNIQQINLNIANINKMVNSLGIPNRDSHDLRHSLAETINATRKLALETNKVMKDYADLSGKDPKVTYLFCSITLALSTTSSNYPYQLTLLRTGNTQTEGQVSIGL